MLGTTTGALAGYLGGVADALVMRVIDIVLAFPFLVLMLAIIAILGPGLSSFIWRWRWWAGSPTPGWYALRY